MYRKTLLKEAVSPGFLHDNAAPEETQRPSQSWKVTKAG